MTKLVVLLLLLLSSTVAGACDKRGAVIEMITSRAWDSISDTMLRNDTMRLPSAPPVPCTDSLLRIDTVGFEEKADVCDHYSKEYICAVLHQVTWRPILCSTYVSYVVKDTVGWKERCRNVSSNGLYIVEDCHWVPIVKKRCCRR